ncbi:uncharacterized protein LOC114320267 isoform X2 [Camellia sinensis]|uniref:uncharacterized protein LOC114320267 isoform X2 n=1 Tax=Camellia sinensis TaxID=4442 RepID=UPI001035F14E|nr:uncharacterized protein LOC114320267 isoform X2 [Camellia sinensis]
MKTLNGFMLSFGGSCLEIIRHPNGIAKEEFMTGQEETGGTGYWFGKMGFAIFQPQQQRSQPGIVPARRCMETVNISTTKVSNQNSSSRCPMKSTTMVKGRLIGKVAADHSHKWIFKEPNDQEINFLSSWQNSADSQPRTWEAQFQSGIKTIALIAVREGVVQLGSVHKVIEDLSHVVLLRKKFSYIESIPGVLLPHPSSSSSSSPPPPPSTYPFNAAAPELAWHFQGHLAPPPIEFYDHFNHQPMMRITPSMSSLEALLSKLPSVVPPSPPAGSTYCEAQPPHYLSPNRNMELMGMEKVVAKEEIDEAQKQEKDVGESSSSMSSYPRHQLHFSNYHHDLNVTSNRPNNEF